jgi:ubiquinone/menaquinone biosynthesis C-methylase UbiE
VTDIANTECFEAWNGDSGRRWADEADRRDHVLAAVAEVLSKAAHLAAGERVLDIGCGCGTTTLDAARAVGPGGRACGIDLSAPMLDIARRRCATAGLTNVEFVQGDAQTHRFASTVDAAISRFGTMFFADPAAAFVNIARGLRPGGRVCFTTWKPLAANDWLTIPGAALLRYGRLPTSAGGGGPGMFGQSDPDTVIATLHAAGYRNVELTPATVTLALGADIDDATNYLASSGVGRAVLETVPTDQRLIAIDAVRSVLADHANGGAVQLDGAIWIIGAVRAT